MRVAIALPMTTAGATDRGTANGIEKRRREGNDCDWLRQGLGPGLHLPFVVVIIIITVVVVRMATSSLQLASRVCVSLKWNAGRRLLSGIIITTYVCTSMLCVVAITIRSRSRSRSRSKSQASRGHQPLPLFSHCARRGAAWFGSVWFCFLPLVFYFSPYVVCNLVCVCVLAALISTWMRQTCHTASVQGWEALCAAGGSGAGERRAKPHEMTKTAKRR